MDPTIQTYRADLIRAAMAANNETNETVAAKAGLATGTVSAIRNGSGNILLSSLKAVADALGLTLEKLFEPKEKAA